jgi:hypothetical protein
MDGSRFDAWTRRRMSLATGGLLASFLGTGVFAGVEAKKCKGNKRKCGKKCISKKKCCGGCGEQTCCKGKCVDLATNPGNCGLCGNACASGECVHGACTCTNFFDDCPQGVGCSCGLYVGGGTVCFSTPDGQCAENDDCPIGSVCLLNGQCSGPCPG